MATDFNSAVDASIASESKLTAASGKVANFCYDSDAYNNDTVAGVTEYDYGEHQNIPFGDATTLNTGTDILDKGVRSQASSITRMMLNHFFGRASYNVNKLADHLKNLLTMFKSFLREGDNAWSPTAEYEAGDVVYFMTTLNNKPCKRTFRCSTDCPGANYPPVDSNGALANTSYWDEVSGKVYGLEVGAPNSGAFNVATFNGSITVDGNITQTGTSYETHAEQVYTKKDNIITREGATGALPAGRFSGIMVNNYDGNGANGILAYRSDGTAVVGKQSGSPSAESLQPLLTRAEASDISNGAPLVWDAANKKAVGGSTAGVSIITAASTTINSIALANNDSIRVMFTAAISDMNATGGVTPLELTYNGVAVHVKASKEGSLVDVFAKQVLTNIWKYLQAWTTLELIYQSDYDGQGNPAFLIVGNPTLLSAANYIYTADGENIKLRDHPIGSLYWSSQSTNPANIFGGTWTAITDKFIYAAGTKTVNVTGGAETVTLVENQIPSHSHSFTGTQDIVTSTCLHYDHTRRYDTGGQSADHTHGMNHVHDHGNMNISGSFTVSGAFFDSANNVFDLKSERGRREGNEGVEGSRGINFDANKNWTGYTGGTLNPDWKNAIPISNTGGASNDHVHNMEHVHTVTPSGTVGSTGGGQAHENMPPYVVKYCWERTA